MSLKTLQDHNEQRREAIRKAREDRHKTGIACPKCGTELYNQHPDLLLASNPPQVRLDCPNPDCKHIAYAMA